MQSHKIYRTSEDIKRELTDILRSLKDPRIKGFISILRVDAAKDLSVAKIYISAIEGLDTAKDAIKGLEAASGFIRRELALRLQLRHTPTLKFIPDNSIEHGAHINKVLESLKNGDE